MPDCPHIIRDAAGLVSEYEYDHYTPTGKVLRNRTSLGEEWRFTYHDGYTEVTDVLGRTEQYHYDYNNELTKRVFADGSAVLMERDGLGRLLSHTDAMGRVTRYQYSNEGQVETIVRPDGAILHFDYDDCYRLIRKSDAEGRYDAYTYDEAGNLLTHTDPLKHTTRFEYADNGLLLSVTDPNGSSTAYHYNENRQPDLITDCSGYETRLAYTPEGQLARITDALGQHTEYHYDADQNLTLALYPDGSKETFGYDAAGRLKTHTDGEGHTTSYEYGQDGLPTRRTNALGHTFGYHYDKARRLIGLTNENGARYRFAYDVLDRLIAESGFDHKLTGYRYNAGNELVEQREFGILNIPVDTNLSDGLNDCTPLIVNDYIRDGSGRLKHIEVHSQNGSVQHRSYHYDTDGRLVRAATSGHSSAFDYNAGGDLIGEYALRLPDAASCAAQGLPELDWQNPEHDMFLLDRSADIRYFYSSGGNLTTVELPDGQRIQNLYYGSGHLHSILFDGDTVTDIEHDKLHREISRTQGALTSRYELDTLGRLKKQIAQLTALTKTNKGKYTHAAVSRNYGYDRTGNLTHTTDQRSGTTHFEYNKLGRIAKADSELFAFDPAHNLLSTQTNNTSDSAATPLSDGLKAVSDNRIREYNGTKFFYDGFGNTIHKEHLDGTTQNLYYDLFHQLVKTETFRHNPNTGGWEKETWVYDYDAMGRRIRKGSLKADGSLGEATEFIWSGSRLLQEVYDNGRYTYIYTDTDSYEPLAQIHNYTNEEGETHQDINYFHCDQIGIPREMTDEDGKLLWFGKYDVWGKLVKETNITGSAHQPFRLQNQYFDRETGLHYNFFRYYDPDIGRFVNQDPIGLDGGENLYGFAPNAAVWSDPLGLEPMDIGKYIPDEYRPKQGWKPPFEMPSYEDVDALSQKYLRKSLNEMLEDALLSMASGGMRAPKAKIPKMAPKPQTKMPQKPNCGVGKCAGKRDAQGKYRDSKGRYANDPNKLNTKLTRPSLRSQTEKDVYARYTKLPNGSYMNKDTFEVVKPPIHIGHKYGWENRRILKAADELGMSQKQVNDYVNARPQNLKLENAKDNLSHKFEKPGIDELQDIKRDMRKFLNGK